LGLEDVYSITEMLTKQINLGFNLHSLVEKNIYFFQFYIFYFYLRLPKNKGSRPVRLGVRTLDFHSRNRGSIPLRATFNLSTPL
jgi:hypothetical protein